MLKRLSEDGSKLFADENGEVIRKNKFGDVIWEGGILLILTEGMLINGEWQEVERSVSFMEAFKALRENSKSIYCMLDGRRHFFRHDGEGTYKFSEDLIGGADWYIED